MRDAKVMCFLEPWLKCQRDMLKQAIVQINKEEPELGNCKDRTRTIRQPQFCLWNGLLQHGARALSLWVDSIVVRRLHSIVSCLGVSRMTGVHILLGGQLAGFWVFAWLIINYPFFLSLCGFPFSVIGNTYQWLPVVFNSFNSLVGGLRRLPDVAQLARWPTVTSMGQDHDLTSLWHMLDKDCKSAAAHIKKN